MCCVYQFYESTVSVEDDGEVDARHLASSSAQPVARCTLDKCLNAQLLFSHPVSKQFKQQSPSQKQKVPKALYYVKLRMIII
jgi:hypothetical protein